MNYGVIRSTAQSNGRFDASQDTQMKDWAIAAYAYVWNAADWQFKKVTAASLSVSASNDAPTLPTDFGDSLKVWDQYGNRLQHLDPDEFEDYYRPDKINGTPGQPEAFKLTNRLLTLGPTPNVSATFRVSYDRRLCTYQSDGTTLRVGGFASASAADTDIPLWEESHHEVLVWKIMEIGGSAESDNSAVMWSETVNDLLGAMIEDLAATKVAPKRNWGKPYRLA
jgi:hypothetical protein